MPTYTVARSQRISARIDRVFETVVDFNTWSAWSPWLIAEPTAKVQVRPTPGLVGSVYAWDGDLIGAGEIQHRRIEPGKEIEDDLRFSRPMKSNCQVAFHFQPHGDETEVTWTMQGNLPWFMFWLTPMLKTVIGMDYGRGLAMLKDWIETGTIPSKVKLMGTEQIGPIRMAGITGSCSVDDVGSSVERTLEQTRKVFKTQRIPLVGPMMTVYTRFSVNRATFNYIAGYAVDDQVRIPSNADLKVWKMPAGFALRVEHTGSYRHLGNAWSFANQAARYSRLKQRRIGTFEIYRNSPEDVPEDQLLTDIYLPLK